MLESWKCSSCQPSEELPQNCEAAAVSENGGTSDNQERNIELQPIGIISTGFVQKRAIPRQPNVNSNSLGKVSLFNYIFTNPEHSLEGLDGFSHMWILFYFHQNQSNHIRAKVAPPRLNGSRVGVFGTRSPHRPCPIGLSLVQINKVEAPILSKLTVQRLRRFGTDRFGLCLGGVSSTSESDDDTSGWLRLLIGNRENNKRYQASDSCWHCQCKPAHPPAKATRIAAMVLDSLQRIQRVNLSLTLTAEAGNALLQENLQLKAEKAQLLEKCTRLEAKLADTTEELEEVDQIKEKCQSKVENLYQELANLQNQLDR
ncbi:hypothetical protein J6590_068911 [Homalodisca vitripennis]|nr:hypothetical protein J6590_068911 [Homalodisca vitripennis]